MRPYSSTLSPNSTNAVIYLPRTTIPTPITTTTKKPGFFNNLRNIFSRGSNMPSTTQKPATNFHVQNMDNVHRKQITTMNPNTHTSRMPNQQMHNTASTIRAPQKLVEEFPPLTPPRYNRLSATSTSAPISNIPLSYSSAAGQSIISTTTTTTTHQPNLPNPLSKSQSASSIISIGSRDDDNSKGSTQRPALATDAEIEEITEILFKKSNPNILPLIMVNLQKRTKSSATSDEASLP